MRIPVFVSCPTNLSAAQDKSRQLVLAQLKRSGLEPRALGRSDYPTEYPLREVYVIAKHCSGGVILGLEQFRAMDGTWKRGKSKEKPLAAPAVFPTAWNHLEAGILYGMSLPLLVCKEDGISDGVFDNGVTDAFVHSMSTDPVSSAERSALGDVFMKWSARVREHYYI